MQAYLHVNDIVEQEFGLRSFLYGSAASGCGLESSDVDVLVLLPEPLQRTLLLQHFGGKTSAGPGRLRNFRRVSPWTVGTAEIRVAHGKTQSRRRGIGWSRSVSVDVHRHAQELLPFYKRQSCPCCHASVYLSICRSIEESPILVCLTYLRRTDICVSCRRVGRFSYTVPTRSSPIRVCVVYMHMCMYTCLYVCIHTYVCMYRLPVG